MTDRKNTNTISETVEFWLTSCKSRTHRIEPTPATEIRGIVDRNTAIAQESDFDVSLWNLAVDTAILGILKSNGLATADGLGEQDHHLITALDLPEDLSQLGPRPEEAIYRKLMDQKRQMAKHLS